MDKKEGSKKVKQAVQNVADLDSPKGIKQVISMPNLVDYPNFDIVEKRANLLYRIVEDLAIIFVMETKALLVGKIVVENRKRNNAIFENVQNVVVNHFIVEKDFKVRKVVLEENQKRRVKPSLKNIVV